LNPSSRTFFTVGESNPRSWCAFWNAIVFLAVVGSSGSGKSSLVKAGLLPRLYRGYASAATSHWRVALLRPGAHPISSLEDAVRRSKALALDASSTEIVARIQMSAQKARYVPEAKALIYSHVLTNLLDRAARCAVSPPGDLTLATFMHIIKCGIDLDNAHPDCLNLVATDCLLPPFDGSKLQVMPWPNFQNMTDRQMTAIYTYISTIPCLEGGPGEKPGRCQ
jgi:hypothetical protein